MAHWEFLVEGYTVDDRIFVPVPIQDPAVGPPATAAAAKTAAAGKAATSKGGSTNGGKQKKSGTAAAALEREKTLELLCSAWGYGNYTALANDSILDPMAAGEGGKEEFEWAERVAEPNLEVYNIYVRGWPFQFMITTGDVKKGEDFYYSYGHA